MTRFMYRSVGTRVEFAIVCDEHGEVASMVLERSNKAFSLIANTLMLLTRKPIPKVDTPWSEGELPAFLSATCSRCVPLIQGDSDDGGRTPGS